MKKRERVFLLVLLAVITAFTSAQTIIAQTQSQASASPCMTRAEHRQFDFWIGDWNVETPQGQRAGTNSIQRILDGCVIFENWTGARGGSGKSFNFYNAGTGKWQQTWVDDKGNALELAGQFKDGAMRFEGESTAANRNKIMNRLTFFLSLLIASANCGSNPQMAERPGAWPLTAHTSERSRLLYVPRFWRRASNS